MIFEKTNASRRVNGITFLVLSTAHLINDMYANFLQQLIPFLIAGNILSVTAAASLVSAFTITSSVMQPIFGYLVDQKGQRWLLYVGTLWMSVLLGTTGYVHNYFILIIITALAGMGTGAFHPQAAGTIGQIESSHKGLILGAFVAAGNMGMSISPLILIPLFNKYGVGSTWLAIIPGVFAALILYLFAPRSKAIAKSSPGFRQVARTIKNAWSELSKLMLVVALRSTVSTGITTFLPLYLLARKFSPEITGSLMFLTLATGAIGGLIGGFISDKYGRKPLIVGSLAISPFFFYGFLYTKGLLSYLLLALGGMTLLSSFSVTVAATQEVVPENKSLASGLSMGFSIGIGGIAVSPIGRFAEIYGVDSAVYLVFILPFLAALLALSLEGGKSNTEHIADSSAL